MKYFNIKKILVASFIIFFCHMVLCAPNEDELYLNISVDSSKMLEPTNKDGSKKMFEPAKYDPAVVVLHYTVSNTINQTVDTYYNRGVSAHFTIDRDGTVYHHIPDGNIAYHAGQSFWHGNYSVNFYSRGIEQINVGFDVTRPWREKPSEVKEADGKVWESWSDEQIKAAAKLVKALSERYNIKPWNIIGHSDCAPGRKVDPGPLFPWKKLYEEYGVGFWPDKGSQITLDQTNRLKNKDYLSLLQALGYATKGFSNFVENTWDLNDIKIESMKKMDKELTDKEVISTFQYHYMQDKFENSPTYRTGTLDEDTKLTILRCIYSLINKDNDYLPRVLMRLYTNDGLSEEAKKLIGSLGFTPKLTINIVNYELKKGEDEL